jgi:hypothetical protein
VTTDPYSVYDLQALLQNGVVSIMTLVALLSLFLFIPFC